MSYRLGCIFLGALFASTAVQARDVEDHIPALVLQDNRSTAQDLVRSYYNAIAMAHYARAFSYTLRGTPAQDPDELAEEYQSFREFYSEKKEIELRMGIGFTSASAGKEVTAIPVVVASTSEDGKDSLYTACHYAVQLSPSAQDYVPYDPIRIDHIERLVVEGDAQTYPMPDCRF